MGAAVAALMMATPAVAGAADDLKLPRQKVELVAPPFVHAHEQATKAGPKIVEFKLTIREKEVVIDEAGTKFHAMTFDGSMPGPMMVVHEGDYMELTLVNPATNAMPHNIDLHSATGALGGGALTRTQKHDGRATRVHDSFSHAAKQKPTRSAAPVRGHDDESCFFRLCLRYDYVDGVTVTGVDDLIRLLSAERIGRKVTFDLLRLGKPRRIEVTPVERLPRG